MWDSEGGDVGQREWDTDAERDRKRAYREQKKQAAEAEQSIKARLEAGAIVQPGDHLAFLNEHSRRNVAWRAVTENLADEVFGQGQGKNYATEILNETQPTVTVSLVVR